MKKWQKSNKPFCYRMKGLYKEALTRYQKNKSYVLLALSIILLTFFIIKYVQIMTIPETRLCYAISWSNNSTPRVLVNRISLFETPQNNVLSKVQYSHQLLICDEIKNAHPNGYNNNILISYLPGIKDNVPLEQLEHGKWMFIKLLYNDKTAKKQKQKAHSKSFLWNDTLPSIVYNQQISSLAEYKFEKRIYKEIPAYPRIKTALERITHLKYKCLLFSRNDISQEIIHFDYWCDSYIGNELTLEISSDKFFNIIDTNIGKINEFPNASYDFEKNMLSKMKQTLRISIPSSTPHSDKQVSLFFEYPQFRNIQNARVFFLTTIIVLLFGRVIRDIALLLKRNTE